jgi:hypothetical protein
MNFVALCEHLERRCGVAAPSTLRARLLAASIDPQTLDWGCIDYELLSSVQGNGGTTGGEVFHLDLMKTHFYGKGFGSSEDEPVSQNALTAEQESLEAES